MKKNFENGVSCFFTKSFTKGFVTIPEDAVGIITKIDGEFVTFKFEGNEELTFPWKDVNDIVGVVVGIDDIIDLEVRFELPSEEELAESQRKVGDGAPPSLVLIVYDPLFNREARFYLHAFRAFCFQISGSITGDGDYGSSPICDLPEIVDKDHGRGIILSMIAYAINQWAYQNSRLTGDWRFNINDFGAGFGDKYYAANEWFEATLDYLRTRRMGGAKK